jgi:hypothetical protein
MPAGIEIKIDTDRPKAMITSNALIFLLETFLTALVNTPKQFSPFEYALDLIQLPFTIKEFFRIIPKFFWSNFADSYLKIAMFLDSAKNGFDCFKF